VVVRGPLYLIEPGTEPSDQRIYSKAVSLIRQLVPAALSDSDPVPFRDQLFRIRWSRYRTHLGQLGEDTLPSLEMATEAGRPSAVGARRVQYAGCPIYLDRRFIGDVRWRDTVV
jgi:hypothetical protein